MTSECTNNPRDDMNLVLKLRRLAEMLLDFSKEFDLPLALELGDKSRCSGDTPNPYFVRVGIDIARFFNYEEVRRTHPDWWWDDPCTEEEAEERADALESARQQEICAIADRLRTIF